jgi:hypothetical protein
MGGKEDAMGPENNAEFKDLWEKINTIHEMLIRVDERQSSMKEDVEIVIAQIKGLPCITHAIMLERLSVKTGIIASVFGVAGAGLAWLVAHLTGIGK